MAQIINGKLHEEWHIADVEGLDASLSEAQCLEVLQSVARSHDANIGINWGVIQCHIDSLKEK